MPKFASKSTNVYLLIAFMFSTVTALAAWKIASNGYGANANNYDMLRSWQRMLLDGIYEPSRGQGNLFSEFFLGFLASQSGPYGANAFSILASIAALVVAFKIFRDIIADDLRIILALLTIMLNPFYVLASSTAMDYMHPIPFCLLGILLLMRDRPTLAAVALAVAAGIRISYFPIGVFALGSAWWLSNDWPRRSSILEAGAAFVLITGLFYVPVFIYSHLTLGFLHAASPDWQGFSGLLARAIYKSVYLYGVIGSIVVLIALVYGTVRYRRSASPAPIAEKRMAAFAVLAIAYHFVLFVGLPVRVEYLLPVLFAAAALFLVLRLSPAILTAVAVTQFLYWFTSIDLLAIQHAPAGRCDPVMALGARLDPHFANGVLMADISGTTKELECYPQRLLQRPSNILEPLPPSPFHRAARPN